MTTIHANGPRDALSRIEAMVGMAGVQLSETATRQMISRAIQLVLQLQRGTDGRRRVVSIGEITGMEGATVTMQEIFKFEQRGVDAQGRVQGAISPTGIRPRLMKRIESFGIDVETVLHAHTRA